MVCSRGAKHAHADYDVCFGINFSTDNGVVPISCAWNNMHRCRFPHSCWHVDHMLTIMTSCGYEKPQKPHTINIQWSSSLPAYLPTYLAWVLRSGQTDSCVVWDPKHKATGEIEFCVSVLFRKHDAPIIHRSTSMTTNQCITIELSPKVEATMFSS